MSTSTADLLRRAKAYPYSRPAYSFLFVNGVSYEIVEMGGDPLRDGVLRVDGRTVPAARVLHDLGVRGAPGIDERVAVIAHGSNAAPETLARKYAGFDEDVTIPVVRGRLTGFDIVYATHISGYGSVPSTLAASPGTVVEASVTFLTPHQLALMHDSEMGAFNYAYGRLSGIGFELDGLGALDRADVYVTRRGALGVTGAPLALAAIAARARRFEAFTKIELLTLVRDRLAPGMDLDAFVEATVRDTALRRAHSDTLRETAHAPELPGFEMLESPVES